MAIKRCDTDIARRVYCDGEGEDWGLIACDADCGYDHCVICWEDCIAIRACVKCGGQVSHDMSLCKLCESTWLNLCGVEQKS